MRYLKKIFSTYKWIAESSFRKGCPDDGEEFVSCWEFFIISSATFVMSMIIGFICVTNLNVLVPDEGWGSEKPADVALEIGDGMGRMAQQIRDHRIGEDLFVLLASSIIWCVIAVILVCGFSYFYRAWGDFRGRLWRNLYDVSILSFRASILWLAISAVFFSIEPVTRQLVGTRIYWISRPWIFPICAVAVTIGVWMWMSCEKMGEWKYVGPQRKLASIFAGLMPAMVVGVMAIGFAGEHFFPQEIQISVSRQCNPSACYVYVKTENLGQIVIDKPIDVRVDVLKIGPAPKSLEHIWGQAKITLTSDQHELVPSIVDPGVEKTLRVQNVSLKCNVDKASTSTYIPTKAEGNTSVYVTNRSLERSYIPAKVVTKGVIAPLFRLSSDSCLK
ncbi:hypothetical protein [Paraburkholderia silvatlantica]|uniref:hypothetical protein n=1 Tax=Paraburkholderia silvatlantica TaxID=321895 RepID=UPI0010602D51|nr:hypothetical protein [Paraburkholderia silvatlantica]TDQ93130.1 hypothetical protein C7412_109110 [Paraburkholderia silvatlantica]